MKWQSSTQAILHTSFRKKPVILVVLHIGWFHICKLECGPMPNVMAAQPPKNVYIVYQPRRWPNTWPSCTVWLASSEQRRCSKEAKTRNQLKFARMPQTNEPISAIGGLKFAILWGHVEETLLLNKFFHCRYMP